MQRAILLVAFMLLLGLSTTATAAKKPVGPSLCAHVYKHGNHPRKQECRTFFRRLYEKWRCIHEREGAWNANTGNGYYGGLQMDTGFQYAYGPEFIRRWGYAHRWPVWAQLVAAERAYQTRGFNPWPNTARMCGVL